MQKIRKGDKVVVLTGKDKGRSGEVIQVMPKEDRAVVKGINVVKRHQRQTQTQQGGIITREGTVDLSNLAVADPKDGKPSVELVAEANGDRVVVALDKVNVTKEPSQMVSLLQGQLGQGKAQADYKSLIDELRKAAKIEYFTDVEATVE